jgi:hypothetical protein
MLLGVWFALTQNCMTDVEQTPVFAVYALLISPDNYLMKHSGKERCLDGFWS